MNIELELTDKQETFLLETEWDEKVVYDGNVIFDELIIVGVLFTEMDDDDEEEEVIQLTIIGDTYLDGIIAGFLADARVN